MNHLGNCQKSNIFESIHSLRGVYLMAWFCNNLGVGALGWGLWKVFELVWARLSLQFLCCLLLVHFQTFVWCLSFQIDHSYSLASPFCSNVLPRLPVVVSDVKGGGLPSRGSFYRLHTWSNYMSPIPSPLSIIDTNKAWSPHCQRDTAPMWTIATLASVHLGSIPAILSQ